MQLRGLGKIKINKLQHGDTWKVCSGRSRILPWHKRRYSNYNNSRYARLTRMVHITLSRFTQSLAYNAETVITVLLDSFVLLHAKVSFYLNIHVYVALHSRQYDLNVSCMHTHTRAHTHATMRKRAYYTRTIYFMYTSYVARSRPCIIENGFAIESWNSISRDIAINRESVRIRVSISASNLPSQFVICFVLTRRHTAKIWGPTYYTLHYVRRWSVAILITFRCSMSHSVWDDIMYIGVIKISRKFFSI